MNFNAGFFLSLILSLNMIFFLAQMSADNINPEGATKFFNYEGSLISDFDAGNYVLNESLDGKLPDSNEGVTVDDDGTLFTDVFKTIGTFFSETLGFKYVWNIVNALPNFLKIIGLPKELVFAIGFFWHVMTLFILMAFMAGRNA